VAKVSDRSTNEGAVQLDLSDVDPRVGQLVGGGQLWEPCSATDIRRWVQAMDHPRFHGPRIRPGDRLTQERRFHGYEVADTRFAGPTMFSSGDTVHTNQHGALVAKERSTSIRYLAADAEKRAFMFDAWGTWHWVAPEGVEDPWITQDAGWIEGFGFDEEGARIDPRKRDGLFVGPARGHVDDERAGEIGMFRAYGYGATMGAWTHDTVAFWAGHDGYIRHSKSQFRAPAFEGDVTHVDAEVVAKNPESAFGMPTVTLAAKLTNQDSAVLVDATLEVELPG
jgi:acyl dehydratase